MFSSQNESKMRRDRAGKWSAGLFRYAGLARGKASKKERETL